MNENFQLNMSRVYNCDAKTLFEALSGDGIFKLTGINEAKSKIDFKVGGEYQVEWDGDACGPTYGVFKKIEPHNTIVFSWDYHSEEFNRDVETEVTLNIKEHEGASTLTLLHTGFESLGVQEAHAMGWDECLTGLRKVLKDVFAKLADNKTGLDLRFKVGEKIKAPVDKVFQAVIQSDLLQKYFSVKASGDFVEGDSITWEFDNYPAFTLRVDEVVENQTIKFFWSTSHVCMSFRQSGENTIVTIDCAGWPATQEGINASYSECNGWTDFLACLCRFIEA